MKNLLVFLTIIFSSCHVFAQDKNIKTETFKVDGNCGMCKERIEDAAFVKGVKRADWNKETKALTIVYRSSKTSSETILNSVAQAGHSSEKVKVKEEDYKSLPECCQYKTNSCEH